MMSKDSQMDIDFPIRDGWARMGAQIFWLQGSGWFF